MFVCQEYLIREYSVCSMNVGWWWSALQRLFDFLGEFIPFCFLVVGKSFDVWEQSKVAFGFYSDDYWKMI